MTQVELKSGAAPIFADECIICGTARPGARVLMTARFNDIQPANDALFEAHHAHVPVCEACTTRLRGSRWLGKSLFWVAVAIGAIGLIAYIEHAPAWAHNDWLMSGLIIVAGALGWAAMSFIYTPHFDFSPHGHFVIYSFRDVNYAQQFARINNGKIR